MPHSLHNPPEIGTSKEECSNTSSIGQLWWNSNLPVQKWTQECPDFLVGQGEKNIGILSSKDEDYKWLSWSDVQHLVEINRIDQFQRPPTDLRRYLEYIYKLKQEYGSVLSFVQHERLHWESANPSSDVPFANSSDYKILFNDWPYGIDRDIVHLVVWTKFVIDEDPSTGDVAADAKAMIEDFVVNTFCGEGGVERKDLIWFKNWKSLKSVHALEHFHIMLYKAPREFLSKMTSGDRPMSDILNESKQD